MHFFKGFFIFFTGVKLVKKHPLLRKWIYIPLILSGLLFFVGNFLSISYISVFVEGALLSMSSWWVYPLLAGLLKATLWFSFSIFLLYGIFSIFSVIASPFHLLLAESLCLQKKFPIASELRMGKQIKLFFFLLLVSLKRLVIFSVLGLLFFILSFLPVISIFSNFAMMWIISLDSMDYVMELKALPLSKRLKLSFAFFPFFLGLSSFLSLSFLIPGSLLMAFPFIVLGSTEYFIENFTEKVKEKITEKTIEKTTETLQNSV